MTDTRDSFEKIAQELRERAETADMVLGRVGQYELKAYAGRIAALQSGAGDADRLNWLANGGWEVMQDPDMWPPNLNFREVIDHGRVVVCLDAIGHAQATEGK